MKTSFLQVLSQIESWVVENLYVVGKYFASWFEKMCQINFLSKIQIISFYNCKITSIQPLLNIQMPQIQNLLLSQNNITNLKPLATLNCKNLQILCLDKNMAVDLDRVLPYCNFIHNISTLMIQSYPQSRIQQQSTNWISKLLNISSSDNSRLSIYFRNIRRIDQKIIVNYRAHQDQNQHEEEQEEEEKYIFQGRRKYQIYYKYNMGFLISDGETSMSSLQSSY